MDDVLEELQQNQHFRKASPTRLQPHELEKRASPTSVTTSKDTPPKSPFLESPFPEVGSARIPSSIETPQKADAEAGLAAPSPANAQNTQPETTAIESPEAMSPAAAAASRMVYAKVGRF